MSNLRVIRSRLAYLGGGVFVLALATAAFAAQPAAAQERIAAQVTDVLDGDTVTARLANGVAVGVRLVGIDAPATGDCAGAQSSAHLGQLVLGRNVFLVPDTKQQGVDGSGRSLYYVDRDDGLDVGLEQLRAGLAEVPEDGVDFDRQGPYRDADAAAAQAGAGVWTLCDGDFHFSHADEQRGRRASAVTFMRRYYRLVSQRRLATAWRLLSGRVKRGIGSFSSWKAGHRRALGVTLRSATARLSGRRAVVSVSLRTRDRDACSGRVVRQSFRGRWVLAPRHDSWVATSEHMHKTGGGRLRVSKSECAPPPPPAPTPAPAPTPSPPADCQGYDPCLPPGPDVDCAGGSGNGPRYVNGPVSVNGSDPYGLDNDGDGVGCET